MTKVRIRLTGTHDDADNLISALHGIGEIERLEEVDDLMPAMRDDSSSANLSDDNATTTVHRIEIEAPSNAAAQRVHDVAELAAESSGLVVEFVDRF